MHAGVKMTVYALEVPLAVFFPCYQKRYCLKAEPVCAVGYSDDCKECLHKIIVTPDGLDDLRRAKFVQSKKYDVFQRIKGLVGAELYCFAELRVRLAA